MMLVALVAVAPAAFTPPQPWALGTGAPPRIPLAGDIDHDGYADLIAVYPPGAAIIDVNLTVDGVKSGGGSQALTNWGTDCQAAAVGDLDGQPGADVVGVFGGDVLRLAGSYKNGKFTDTPTWAKLPRKVKDPAIAVLKGGREVLVFSKTDGEAWRVDAKGKTAVAASVPRGTVWIGDAGTRLAAQSTAGEVMWLDGQTLKPAGRLGTNRAGSRPAAAPGLVAFGNQAWTRRGMQPLAPTPLPETDVTLAAADFDRDGDIDIVEYRNGKEAHTAHQIRLRRAISQGEADADRDGLTTEEEARLRTDPLNPDTDNDGLLDGWEAKGFRGLDMPKLGCNPRRTDVICLVSRFEGVKEETLKAGMARADKFYKELETPNPDGSKGFSFHPVYLDPIRGEDTKRPWWANRDRLLPSKWKGVAHWMQVTPGGGGQADQLGDGGTCGEGALWAVFVHEFGHQMGLSHEGFWENGWSPTYISLMSYNYSYSLEDDANKIRYSDGALVDYVVRENDLDEELPLPYEKVKFLEKGPYRFRLKPNGKTTLIDWNWNGVFGEKHVKADINYAYSTHAGRRDEVAKTQTSPWLFVHDGAAYVLFGQADAKGDGKADPTLGPTRKGKAILRKLKKPYEWDAPQTVVADGLVGDPVAASFGGKIWLAYPTDKGTILRPQDGAAITLSPDPAVVPSVGVFGGRLWISLWDTARGEVSLRAVTADGRMSDIGKLGVTSTNPPGLAENPKSGELIVAIAQNQDEKRPNRWQVRRYRVTDDALAVTGVEWVEGDTGQTRGTGRLTVLFDASPEAGPEGRIYVYGRGMTTPQSPWACTYVASQIADKTIKGGWLVRRYYDEWTQSRSAPAAAWFGGDVIWAYRWVDGAQGPTDDNLHVGYAGLGIQSDPMGDHDDISYLRNFGVRHSILSLGRG
ncbi:MAG: hypothetical protein ACO1SV_04105 [Fimbriimonas sp.]